MKQILLSLLFFISVNIYAQNEGREMKSNYFTIGVYSGYYIGNPPLLPAKSRINTITVEVEYFKFNDFSIIFREIYQFTRSQLYDLEGWNEEDGYRLNEPKTSRENMSIMGRYYLGGSNFRPYLQTGLNHEFNYIGDYTVDFLDQSGNVYHTFKNHSYSINRYSLNFGTGINIKLTNKFALDMNYDIYKALGNNNGVESFYDENSDIRSGFNGYSFQMGLKYTF